MKQVRSIIKNVFLLLKIAWGENRWLLIGYFATAVLGVIFSYAAYFAYKAMIDQIFKTITLDKSSAFFFVISTYLFTTYVSYFFYNVLNQYYFDFVLRTHIQNLLTRIFMEKLAHLDFAHLENGEVRNLIAKVQDTYMWRLPEILSRVNFIIYNVFSIIISIGIAFQFDIRYFLVLIAITMPFYYFKARYGNAAWSAYSKDAPKTNKLWYLKYIFQNFQTLSEMKLYGLKNYFLSETKTLQKDLLLDFQEPIKKYTILSIANYIVTPFIMYIAIASFLSHIVHGKYTIGDFTLFTSILFSFTSQFSFILTHISLLYENNLYAADYFKLLHIQNTIVDTPTSTIFPEIKPREIIFDNVSFTYPGNKKPSLHHVSFTIHRGEDIAIVGHNGAGKTTIIKLLLRFYDPTEGRILVDGIDLRDINLANWYQHIGVLFQDFARYNLSLEENVFLGNIENGEKDTIEAVLASAQAKDIISSLPNGKKQMLGRWFHDGQELSTGQWQKVAIARALFREAPILIMDEPTANIDAEAEAAIFENLKKVYQEKSLIFISHRFSTVRMADNIFVIDNGKLVEQGAHTALLKQKGLYAKYFALQKKGYE